MRTIVLFGIVLTDILGEADRWWNDFNTSFTSSNKFIGEYEVGYQITVAHFYCVYNAKPCKAISNLNSIQDSDSELVWENSYAVVNLWKSEQC